MTNKQNNNNHFTKHHITWMEWHTYYMICMGKYFNQRRRNSFQCLAQLCVNLLLPIFNISSLRIFCSICYFHSKKNLLYHFFASMFFVVFILWFRFLFFLYGWIFLWETHLLFHLLLAKKCKKCKTCQKMVWLQHNYCYRMVLIQ